MHSHVKSIYRKLGVSSRAEAVRARERRPALDHLGEPPRGDDSVTYARGRLRRDDADAAGYEFVLRGEIGDHFALLFEGMRLERVAGTTVLTGPVRDQAHLHGVIERIQELGIELVSVNPVNEPKDARMSPDATPDTIVLIHGFWVTPRSWEHWIAHYEARGFQRPRPRLPRLRGRGRGAQRRPVADRGGDRAADHRAPRGASSARSTRRRS